MPLPVALGVAGTLLGAGMNISNYFSARDSRNRAQRMLAELNKQALPTYTADPTIGQYYSTASNMFSSPKGYTGAERANLRQGIAGQMYGQRSAAQNIVGGSSSRALNALSLLPTIGAENQFAASDAGLARNQQNIAGNRMFQAANVFQNVRNANTEAALRRRLMTEQALGGAISSNEDYMRNTLTGFGSDIMGAGLYGLLGGGGAGRTSTTRPARSGYLSPRDPEYITPARPVRRGYLSPSEPEYIPQ